MDFEVELRVTAGQRGRLYRPVTRSQLQLQPTPERSREAAAGATQAPIQAVERIIWVPLALRPTPEQSRSRWRFLAAE
ncbi:MAG: hypothetical protein CMJ75_11320 [Planctomycetaceae bacterium]|nr:hypothetical protein [Planctomycetaceae bacterium]